LLAAEDILDWPRFMTTLQGQSTRPEPSPGRRIAQLLEPDARAQLAALQPEATLDEQGKQALVRRLNRLLERGDFYREDAWSAVDLDPRIRQQAGESAGLDDAQRIPLNRHLLELAFPGMIARYSPGDEADATAPPESTSTQGYSHMDIEKAPETLVQAGRLRSITGGAELTLRSADPDQQPMLLEGREMHMTFSEGDSRSPDRVELNGDVSVKDAEKRIESDTANLNLIAGKLVFAGNVACDLPTISGARTQRAEYDLDTGNVVMTGRTRAKEVVWQEESDPALLTVKDILDWPEFLTTLQTQAARATPSPGKRITELLEPAKRRQLAAFPADQPLDEEAKRGIVNFLNDLLAKENVYNAQAWAAVPIAPEAKEALAQGMAGLDRRKRIRLNRYLLEAAYPGLIAPLRNRESAASSTRPTNGA
jgi:hypothetical protein